MVNNEQYTDKIKSHIIFYFNIIHKQIRKIVLIDFRYKLFPNGFFLVTEIYATVSTSIMMHDIENARPETKIFKITEYSHPEILHQTATTVQII